jgi:hypothetical protein
MTFYMPAKSHERDNGVEMQAVKALVAVYGGRETARRTGLPLGTILSWCYRYKWRKASGLKQVQKPLPISGKDAGEAIRDVMSQHKEEASVSLAQYAARAAKKAAGHERPLEIARAVRDVAQVYRSVWPAEDGRQLLEGSLLLGAAKVVDDPAEMLKAVEEGQQTLEADVREEVSDQGPASD